MASEFRYREPLVDEKTLFIAISQSGETLDTLAALREAKSKGARILSVVNVVVSSVARESDDVFYTWAGPEIAVASTKAYTTQLTCMYILGLYMGLSRGMITEEFYREFMDDLKEIPGKLAEYLKDVREIEDLAKILYNRDQVFFIGRGLDSAVAYEGSLKLKEISYINSFAFRIFRKLNPEAHTCFPSQKKATGKSKRRAMKLFTFRTAGMKSHRS